MWLTGIRVRRAALVGMLLLPVGVRAQAPAATSAPVVSVGEAVRYSQTSKPTPIQIAVVLISDPIHLGTTVGALVYGQDGTAGLQLFTRQPALFDGLKLGDRVAAWGVPANYKGMPELLVDGLRLLAHGPPPTPHDVLAASVASGHDQGELVRVTGILDLTRATAGMDAVLHDHSGTVAIFLPRWMFGDPAFLRELANGGPATVTGVAMRLGGPFEVEPRGPQDVVVRPRPSYRAWAASAMLLLLVAVVILLWRRRRDSEERARALEALVVVLRRSQEELAASEEKLRHMQKMDAIGRLASGIAHDFNNLLTVIGGQAQLLQATLPEPSRERRRAEEIIEASDRAAQLTQQLLTFSRQQVPRPRRLDLNAVVQSASLMLQRVLGDHIQLKTCLRPELGPVLADAGQLDQIILNLTINARDAMPQGGELVIETCEENLAPSFAGASPSAAPGPYIVLAVRDNGCGMDEATQARACEPFFTTKPLGKGTGLGLATVYGIVHQNGGFLAITSTPGEGTTVRIYLPRGEENDVKNGRHAVGQPTTNN